MRRARLLTPLLALVLLPSLAHAAGVSIRWSDCYVDGGVQNKNFACNTNGGSGLLVGSFVPAGDIANVSLLEMIVDVASSSSGLPDWWAFKNSGTCRQTAMTVNFAIPATAVNCQDWAQGLSAGGVQAYTIGIRGPNTARWTIGIAVAPGSEESLTGGVEYFAGNINITHTKTVGTAACAGCMTPACLIFNSLNVNTLIPADNRYLTGPSNLTDSDYATWQGGGAPVVGAGVGCPAATPTTTRTWGAVKALYR